MNDLDVGQLRNYPMTQQPLRTRDGRYVAPPAALAGIMHLVGADEDFQTPEDNEEIPRMASDLPSNIDTFDTRTQVGRATGDHPALRGDSSQVIPESDREEDEHKDADESDDGRSGASDDQGTRSVGWDGDFPSLDAASEIGSARRDHRGGGSIGSPGAAASRALQDSLSVASRRTSGYRGGEQTTAAQSARSIHSRTSAPLSVGSSRFSGHVDDAVTNSDGGSDGGRTSALIQALTRAERERAETEAHRVVSTRRRRSGTGSTPSHRSSVGQRSRRSNNSAGSLSGTTVSATRSSRSGHGGARTHRRRRRRSGRDYAMDHVSIGSGATVSSASMNHVRGMAPGGVGLRAPSRRAVPTAPAMAPEMLDSCATDYQRQIARLMYSEELDFMRLSNNNIPKITEDMSLDQVTRLYWVYSRQQDCARTVKFAKLCVLIVTGLCMLANYRFRFFRWSNLLVQIDQQLDKPEYQGTLYEIGVACGYRTWGSGVGGLVLGLGMTAATNHLMTVAAEDGKSMAQDAVGAIFGSENPIGGLLGSFLGGGGGTGTGTGNGSSTGGSIPATKPQEPSASGSFQQEMGAGNSQSFLSQARSVGGRRSEDLLPMVRNVFTSLSPVVGDDVHNAASSGGTKTDGGNATEPAADKPASEWRHRMAPSGKNGSNFENVF